MAERPNKPSVEYRVEVQRRIEINRSYKERRNQAAALRILSFGLFGKKRYQNLYLGASLGCLFQALKIANTVHSRVPGLAMIIKFEDVDVIQYYVQEFQGKTYESKKYSRIVIKLTKDPSQEDKLQPGYNAGLKNDDISHPLTEVISFRSARRNEQGNNGSNQRRFPKDRIRKDSKEKNQNKQKKHEQTKKSVVNAKQEDKAKRQQYQWQEYERNGRRENKRRTNQKDKDKGFKRYAEDRQDQKEKGKQQRQKSQGKRNSNKEEYKPSEKQIAKKEESKPNQNDKANKEENKHGQKDKANEEEYKRGQKRSRAQNRVPSGNSSRNQPEQA